MPSNFKENTTDCWENISSHQERSKIQGWEISGNFLPMLFLFKPMAFSDIFSLSKSLLKSFFVKKLHSYYGIFTMVSACLSFPFRRGYFEPGKELYSSSFWEIWPGSHWGGGANSALLKASAQLGTSLWEKWTILQTFRGKLRPFILILINIKNGYTGDKIA